MIIKGNPLVPGTATGEVLKLAAPICFWGGLDPATAKISDPNHPDFGTVIEDKIVAIPGILGSSSSSQYLMELMLLDKAPPAILLGDRDIIIAMAVIVGREMGYGEFPLIACDIGGLETGMHVAIETDGSVTTALSSDDAPQLQGC